MFTTVWFLIIKKIIYGADNATIMLTTEDMVKLIIKIMNSLSEWLDNQTTMSISSNNVDFLDYFFQINRDETMHYACVADRLLCYLLMIQPQVYAYTYSRNK